MQGCRGLREVSSSMGYASTLQREITVKMRRSIIEERNMEIFEAHSFRTMDGIL